MNKVLVLLMSLIAVNHVTSKPNSVEFAPKALRYDLQEISKYHNTIDDSLVAYVDWPESITYRIQSTKKNSQKYLKIDGEFRWMEATYDLLYYAETKFYVEVHGNGDMTEIPPDATLIYSNERNPEIHIKPESYLSIKYFGLNEILENARKEYTKKQSYYSRFLPKYQTTFLLSSFNGHFLEYTFWSVWDTPPVLADGGVLVLVGNKQNSRSVSNIIETSKIVLDPTVQFTIPDTFDNNSPKVISQEDFFGCRMATIGVLAFHKGPGIWMINSSDMDGQTGNPDRHDIFLHQFVEKVKLVEPRIHDNYGSTSLPEYGKFQVMGHILVKHVNNVKGKERLDPECPFVIKFVSQGQYFLIETSEKPLTELCTDDSRVWPKGMKSSVFFPMWKLQLVYH